MSMLPPTKRTSKASIRSLTKKTSSIIKLELHVKERNEIITNIIDDLLCDVSMYGWEKYLYKEVVKFNVKCCHKALCDIVDLFHMPIDQGEKYIDEKSLWKNDLAASISEKDCSQGRCDK